MVNAYAGRPAEAEGWYHKALAVLKQAGDQVGTAKVLLNLADLLRNQPDRLAKARQWAEQARTIQQTLVVLTTVMLCLENLV
jgi:hypothetical protein